MAYQAAKLLTLLQFTRAALVFTALADTLCALMLRAARSGAGGGWGGLGLWSTAAALATSACLYAFGMALNDLVDHRRDKLLAASRPIPSGRLGVYTAHVIVSALGLASLLFGGVYAFLTSSVASFAFLLLTLLLINFYNFAGKYLVSAGLLTLGLVRMSHVLIAAPDFPVVWHPLWLFTHVTILSAVAYVWEEKRPRITAGHASVLYMGLILVNLITVAGLLSVRHEAGGPASLGATARTLAISWGLLVPVAATVGFVLLAGRIGSAVGRRTDAPEAAVASAQPSSIEPAPPAAGAPNTTPTEIAGVPLRTRRRQAGQRLILAGLLWLIVYDAAFVLGYVGIWQALVVLLLVPVAYGSVRVMRGWSKLVQLARPPRFRQGGVA